MRHMVLAAVVAALAMSGTASAQFTEQRTVIEPSGVTFRAGIGIPLDGTLQDVGDTLASAGMEFQFTRSLFERGESFVSLDWFGKGINGDKGNVFTLTLNQRLYGNVGLDTSNRTYMFGGIGAAFIDVDNSDTVVCARGGIGAELSNHIIAEASITVSLEAEDGTRANVVGVYLGYRF